MLYRAFYNIVATLTPLLTTPYVARTLGADGVGKFSYTLSIASYFALAAMLGITTYGCKEIAKCAEDKDKRSKCFFEIYNIQIVLSITSFAAYFLYVTFFEGKYLTLFLIQGVRIAACVFDVNWVLFGLEEFETTVKRDFLIKLLTIFSIFIFVKGRDALIIYTLIMCITTLLSAVIVLPFVAKRVSFVRTRREDVLRRMFPVFLYFVPTISSSLFHEVDVTILGKYNMLSEAGCYHNADRIINIPKGIIIGLGTVFLSRATRLINEDPLKNRNLYIKMNEVYTFLVSPIAIGIASISEDFVPLFLGAGYERSTGLIYWLSIVLVIRTYNNHLLTGYYLPYEKERSYTFIALITTVLNILLDIIVIKNHGAVGAVWVTILCEGIVLLYLILNADKKITRLGRGEKMSVLIYFVFGLIMYFVIVLLKQFLACDGMLKVLLEIAVGFVVYAVLCILYWRINPSSAVGNELNKIRRKKK